MQYVTFSLFSLPVMAFRILEMYFFLMLTIRVFIKQKIIIFFFLQSVNFIVSNILLSYGFGVINV